VFTHRTSGVRQLVWNAQLPHAHEGITGYKPSYVQLYWGSGFLGGTGFYIGRTNFTMDASLGHAWQPGVYFYRR
jgi:hypothetical protein